MELDLENFQANFTKLITVYGRLVSEFDYGRKMRFWVYPDLIKSDKAKELLTKAYERQKFF